MSCENSALNISVIIRQKQLLMSDPDSYAPLCLPTCFVYSMFQSSLVHLAIVMQNRDSLRQRQSLKRSIELLQQYDHLVSARRACSILSMLVEMNQIYLEDVPEQNLSLPESPMSPVKNELVYNQSEQYMDDFSFDDDEQMPKSSFYMRMMNTSIVGGITQDLHNMPQYEYYPHYTTLPKSKGIMFDEQPKNNQAQPYYQQPYIPAATSSLSSSSIHSMQPSNLNWNEWDSYLTQQKPYPIL